ncbi:MAG: anti-sigma factor [Pseudohongiellaceae bacterium]|nr:anti-sigma factor [Pseudohongiellaceae bacterium]
MLSCRDLSHHAGDYVEKQLTFKQRLGYGLHLLLCGHCRQFLRHFRSTLAYTKALQSSQQISDAEAADITQKVLEQAKK